MEDDLMKINKGINDIWQLIKKYLPAADPDDDDYWRRLIDECDGIDKKHGGHALIRQMMLATTNYIESEAKRNAHA